MNSGKNAEIKFNEFYKIQTIFMFVLMIILHFYKFSFLTIYLIVGMIPDVLAS